MDTPRFFVEYGQSSGSIVLMGVVLSGVQESTRTGIQDDSDLLLPGYAPEFRLRGVSWAFREGSPVEARVTGHLSNVGPMRQNELRVHPWPLGFITERLALKSNDSTTWLHGDVHEVRLGALDLRKPNRYLSETQRAEVLSVLQHEDNISKTRVLLESES